MAAEISAEDLAKYGFHRPEMNTASLAFTVDPPLDRHMFLCYKSVADWPPKVEDSETDLLPKKFSGAIRGRKNDIKVKTRLTICEADEKVGLLDGDVLIFPELIKYRGLKDEDVDSFVDEVLVNGKPWASGVGEALTAGFVFVCAHASRDKRCGVCGPILIDKFNEEIQSAGLHNQVIVSACSHIGGHKYAGNVIIFATDSEGKVVGDWYGYVTPDDVAELLAASFERKEIVDRLWRGRMGLSKDAAEENMVIPGKKEKQEEIKEKPLENGIREIKEKPVENGSQEIKENAFTCCQGANGISCCRDETPATNGVVENAKPKEAPEVQEKQACVSLPAWLGKWGHSDLLMAAAVVGALATVAVGYSHYKRSG
ncbi:Altered inheritance of mitochondria protein 32-like protein [Drosera capensis]